MVSVRSPKIIGKFDPISASGVLAASDEAVPGEFGEERRSGVCEGVEGAGGEGVKLSLCADQGIETATPRGSSGTLGGLVRR